MDTGKFLRFEFFRDTEIEASESNTFFRNHFVFYPRLRVCPTDAPLPCQPRRSSFAGCRWGTLRHCQPWWKEFPEHSGAWNCTRKRWHSIFPRRGEKARTTVEYCVGVQSENGPGLWRHDGGQRPPEWGVSHLHGVSRYPSVIITCYLPSFSDFRKRAHQMRPILWRQSTRLPWLLPVSLHSTNRRLDAWIFEGRARQNPSLATTNEGRRACHDWRT